MLKRLRIKSYAIVRDMTVEFDDGLTILSGETGAGKSIIVGALNMIFGERASADAVRSGEQTSVIEAELSDVVDRCADTLRAGEIDVEGDCLMLRREVSAKGTSRAFINDHLVPVSTLRSVASLMFDIVGQHQHQNLIDADQHVFFLDSFAGLNDVRECVSEMYDSYCSTRSRLDELRKKSAGIRESLDLHRFQRDEIEKAALTAEEEERLLLEQKILQNAGKLRATLGAAAGAIFMDDHSTTSQLAQIESLLRDVIDIDPIVAEQSESLSSARYMLEDVGRALSSRMSDIDEDPSRLSTIEERLDVYYQLKKKYGGSVEAIDSYFDEISADLSSSENLDGEIVGLETELSRVTEELAEKSIDLSNRRSAASATLSKQVEKELAQLGISKGRFEVRVNRRDDSGGLGADSDGRRYRIDRDGIDDVEFFFGANPGEELRPLARIASGGELSRVMLALKTVGAARHKLETLIFDEIDSGIGGETASAVGRKLRRLSERHQILVITHLQQIAAAGEHHFRVFKEKSEGRMVTRIQKLTSGERRAEIARMLSGDNPTATSLKQADELLGQYS